MLRIKIRFQRLDTDFQRVYLIDELDVQVFLLAHYRCNSAPNDTKPLAEMSTVCSVTANRAFT